MNTRKTATEIRVEESSRQRAFAVLYENPHLQAEAIANHYIAHAEIALQLKRILELEKNVVDPSIHAHDCISLMVNQIKTNHLHDLGIELEWKKPIEPEWISEAMNQGKGTYKP